MTLDEAIKHCEEKTVELRNKARHMDVVNDYDEWSDCKDCADDHEQLAKWLSELKELKEAYASDYQIDDLIQVCVRLWG